MFKLIFLIFIFSVHAQATLGERSAYAKASADKQVRSTVKSLYSVNEVQEQYLTIREYVSGGIVFAVSWAGAGRPNLNELLGKYFADYEDHSSPAQKVQGMRSHRQIRGNEVIVEVSGQMRSMQGKAYAPALMPKGVTSDEIY